MNVYISPTVGVRGTFLPFIRRVLGETGQGEYYTRMFEFPLDRVETLIRTHSGQRGESRVRHEFNF